MLKKFEKQLKNEKGLTLIELLAVIVILQLLRQLRFRRLEISLTTRKTKQYLLKHLIFWLVRKYSFDEA